MDYNFFCLAGIYGSGHMEEGVYFATMGASNCINVEGHLPKDRERMVKWLDEVIGPE